MGTEGYAQSPKPVGDLAMRFGGRTIAGLLLLVIAAILVGSTTTLSWWNLSGSDGYTSGWYLGNVCSAGSCQDYSSYPALHDMFSLANALILGALVLSIVAAVLFVVSILRPQVGTGVLVAGVLGSVLALAAPVYVYVALPGAVQASVPGQSLVIGFFGSETQPGAPVWYAWGGGSGWYLAFVAFTMLLISTFVAFSASRHLAAFGNARISSPMPQVQTTMPPEAFCPSCGAHYPAGTQFCSKDATPLKQAT